MVSPWIPSSLNTNLAKDWTASLNEHLDDDLRTSLNGLSRYTRAYESFTPHQPTMQTIWQEGASRLLTTTQPMDSHCPNVLIVPSLINRWTIFDLLPDVSMIKHLIKHGIRPYVMDWGDPSEHEHTFNLADYVTKRLLPAINALPNHAPMHMLGYCLGGVMSIAATQLSVRDITSLTLIATPWDFTQEQPVNDSLELLFHDTSPIDKHSIHSWFFMQHMQDVLSKFKDFAEMNDDTECRLFLAKEHWLNDGVDLPVNVAKECFFTWPRENSLLYGEWQVGGQAIELQNITCPTLLFTAEHDKIVSKQASEPLTSIPHHHLRHVQTGHLGLIAGNHALDDVWNPLVNHLKSR